MPKDIITEVKKQMEKLLSERRSELARISEEISACKTDKATAEDELKKATATLDFDSYEKAKQEFVRAETKIEMLTDRYNQILKNEYLTESESDKVIDSIKAWEHELSEEYHKAIAEPIKTLQELTKKYLAGIKDAENLMRSWTNEIHANYRSETTTYANGTNRSDTPVPVRNVPYTGSQTSKAVNDFVNSMSIKKIL